jgi:hypothetical protein
MTQSPLNYLGRATAFKALGFSPEQVKTAFALDGLSDKVAEDLTKEAWGPAVGLLTRGLTRAGKGLMGLAGKTPSLGMNPTLGGRLANFAGTNVGRFGSQLTGAAQRVGQVGLPSALREGALNMGKGFIGMRSAKGLGSTLGQGAAAAGTVSAIGSLMPGRQPQPQNYMGQMQMPYGY